MSSARCPLFFTNSHHYVARAIIGTSCVSNAPTAITATAATAPTKKAAAAEVVALPVCVRIPPWGETLASGSTCVRAQPSQIDLGVCGAIVGGPGVHFHTRLWRPQPVGVRLATVEQGVARTAHARPEILGHEPIDDGVKTGVYERQQEQHDLECKNTKSLDICILRYLSPPLSLSLLHPSSLSLHILYNHIIILYMCLYLYII